MANKPSVTVLRFARLRPEREVVMNVRDSLIKLGGLLGTLLLLVQDNAKVSIGRPELVALLVRVKREVEYERGRADRSDWADNNGRAKSADGAYLNGFYSDEGGAYCAYYLSREDWNFLNTLK
jgi:hypothetical protein